MKIQPVCEIRLCEIVNILADKQTNALYNGACLFVTGNFTIFRADNISHVSLSSCWRLRFTCNADNVRPKMLLSYYYVHVQVRMPKG